MSGIGEAYGAACPDVLPKRDYSSLYLIRMSFLTELTPSMLRAMTIAWSMASFEVTNPLSCTTPLKVSTLTSLALTKGSSISAAFTLVVIQVSSMYSPVLSRVALPAHPTAVINRAASSDVERAFMRFMAIFLYLAVRLWCIMKPSRGMICTPAHTRPEHKPRGGSQPSRRAPGCTVSERLGFQQSILVGGP
jgi:hypothetical protein